MSDFARLNIQIYDVHIVDLYQWVRAPYLVGVEGDAQGVLHSEG